MAFLLFLQPKRKQIACHLHFMGWGLDSYSSKYDNFIVLMEISYTFKKQSCGFYNLKKVSWKSLHVLEILTICLALT